MTTELNGKLTKEDKIIKERISNRNVQKELKKIRRDIEELKQTQRSLRLIN